MESKAALRRRLRQQRAAIPGPLRRELAAAACRRVADSGLWKDAESVLCYAALGSEIDCDELIRTGWRQGKRVLLPLCREDPRRLEFYEVTGWEQTAPGAWGIREPDPLRCSPVAAEDIALAVVPVVGMDRRGVRLGNGGGYYDRMMARFAVSVLLGFDEQLVDRLPRQSHDVPAQWIATPTLWLMARNDHEKDNQLQP